MYNLMAKATDPQQAANEKAAEIWALSDADHDQSTAHQEAWALMAESAATLAAFLAGARLAQAQEMGRKASLGDMA